MEFKTDSGSLTTWVQVKITASNSSKNRVLEKRRFEFIFKKIIPSNSFLQFQQ